jgi:hypothetical protein
MSSVAQLEATAERLSLTSSIDDAIRDLHGEMKRSDSRRSSILAANVMSANDEAAAATQNQILRHLSTTSSIVSTNIAARHGGYSPAAFVMSPNTSQTTRVPPVAKSATSNIDCEAPAALSRHGPGKSSVRSVRSTKPSLADISESDPTSLTQDVLDQADAAPPITEEEHCSQNAFQPSCDDILTPDTNDFDDLLNNGFVAESTDRRRYHGENQDETEEALSRPSTSHSQDTFQQAQHAFFDFDGVHCAEDGRQQHRQEDNDDFKEVERDEENPLLPPGAVAVGMLRDEEENQLDHHEVLSERPDLPAAIPRPRPAPAGMVRPQSYVDPSGVQMLYYPARVPAQLNLPQKLSSKLKATHRNSRQQKVLSAMMEPSSLTPPAVGDSQQRFSAMPILGRPIESAPNRNLSSTSEQCSDHRASYISLPAEEYMYDTTTAAHNSDQLDTAEEPETRLADTLRVPQRLTRTANKRHKTKASTTSTIPSHLRASAYFDQPSTLAHIQLKDGSAMSTLDSMLDASASAPVSAFTDHLYAGKLGPEVYGKALKHKSTSSSSQEKLPERQVKTRSSFLWPSKRSTSYNSDADRSRTESIHAADNPKSSASDRSSDNVIRIPGPVGDETLENAGEDEDQDYEGAPTTLLAELQLRKQQQKDRLVNRIANAAGTHTTLLEMDAIAETQRVDRKSKRITLAWEDPQTHLDQNGSDDEDVPLAIIAAKHQGAKNMADLERPLGLMERREIEENEPLSRRRARLQGRDVSLNLPRPTSAMRLSPSRLGDLKPPQSIPSLTPEPVEEVEGETLADRKRRLAPSEENSHSLPPTRPVSRAFSAELLSQFGDLEEAKNEPAKEENEEAEEETLGQRRRRLQAEKAARDKEMGSGIASMSAPKVTHNRQMSLSSMLAAHPRKSPDLRVQEERQRREEEERLVRERESKLAAMRLQMPSTLSVPSYGQRGGYRGRSYNDGNGGSSSVQHPRPVTAHFTHTAGAPYNRHGSGVYHGGFHQAKGGVNQYQIANMQHAYADTLPNGYGMPPQQAQMPMPMKNGSLDRVEMWRQSVLP